MCSMAATTLADRALIRLSGEDVRGFLQGLVTNDVDLLAPDRPLWAGLLTPQGKALFDFILWAGRRRRADRLRARRSAADLARRLALYRLRRAIRIEREDELARPLGPRRRRGVPDPRLPALGRRWLAAEDGAGGAGWRAHRLSLGVTEGLAELGSDKILWLEATPPS